MVDTGYWYAICDRNDAYHDDAASRFAAFESYGMIFPWPCLYETLTTRFVENPSAMQRFALIARRSNVEHLDDAPYREPAYERDEDCPCASDQSRRHGDETDA